MSLRKGISAGATSQFPPRGVNVGVLNSLWKEENSSDWFLAVPNGPGYVDLPEESTWSKNTDSAASMFPPPTLTPTLGEIFQDLSSWCYKPLQDTSSTMVGDRNGSSCIVQDDDRNAPETGVQREFNLTSPPSVLREHTSYLSDREGWEIPQMSSVEDKSFVTTKKTDSDNTQCKQTNEFFVDGTWGLFVTHEEEIMSSHNQEGLNLEGFVVNEESDNVKTTVNTYELEHTVKCMHFGSCESASKASLGAFNKAGTVENTNVRIGSFESLLGPNFDVRPVDNGIFSVNQQQVEPNLSLKNLLSGSICHSNTNVGVEIRGAVQTHDRVGRLTNDVMNTIFLAKSQGDSPLKPDTYLLSQTMESDETFGENGESGTTASVLRTETSLNMQEQPNPGIFKQVETVVPAEILANRLSSLSSHDNKTSGDVHVLRPQLAVKEENVTKRNLKLDLTPLLGSDEIISTPVVLESLLKQNEPFDLLSYVFNEFGSDTVLPASVEFDRISMSYKSEVTDTVEREVEPFIGDLEVVAGTEDDTAANLTVVKPFVAEKSPGRQRSYAKAEHMDVEEECNQFSSSSKLLGKPNQQFEGGNLRKGLKGNKDEHLPKVRRSRKELEAPGFSLESKVSQDGPVLKLRISTIKPASSTTGLSSQKLSPRKNISGLEELSLPKEKRGRPVKQVFPSASEEKSSSRGKSQRRKSSNSIADESGTPSKRSRMFSVDAVSDRYRELRDKNNEASRKSRQNRKARESEMKEAAAKLEKENQSLKIKADELERLVKKLREALLEDMIKTKKK